MDATLRLILDTKALLQRLSDVVREWTASTSRMSRAAEGVDFDLAQREATQLRQVVEQMASAVVGNLAKIDTAAQKIKTDASEREVKQLEKSILQLSNAAEREFAKMERASRRVQLQQLRKEAKEAESAITRMAKEADKELKVVEKAAERIQFKRAKEEARQVEQAIRTLEQSGARSFRSLEQRAEAAGLKLQSGIGGALTRLPPQVQVLQRRFETAMAAMRNAADRVSFQKAQAEAQRLEAAIHRMGQAAQRDLDRIKQSAQAASSSFSQLGSVAGNLNRILGSLGIFLSARVLLQWGKDAVDAAVQLESFTAQIKASTDTLEEAADLTAFANDQTERLGLAYRSVVEGTARFAAATKNSNLSLDERKDILKNVFEAARVLNLSEQRLQNTLLAVEQIASKSTVSMEELRRQLGDNLPGAVAILAKEMGVTQQQLLKLIETNQVFSDEALRALFSTGRGFSEVFGKSVPEALETTAAKIGRLQKQIFDLKVAFVRGFEDEMRTAVDGLTKSLSGAEDQAESTGRTVARVFRGITEEAQDAKNIIGFIIQLFDDPVQAVNDLLKKLAIGVAEEARSAEEAVKDLGNSFSETDGILARLADSSKGLFREIANGPESVRETLRDLDRALSEAFDASELASLEVATKSLQDAFNQLAEDAGTLSDLQKTNAIAHDLLLEAFNKLISRYREEGRELPALFVQLAESIGIARSSFEDIQGPADKLKDKIQAAVDAVDSTEDPFTRAAEIARTYRDRLLELTEGVDLEEVSESQARALLLVADALEEAANRAKNTQDELFGTEKAAESLADKLRDLVAGLDLENLTEQQSEVIRDLIEDVEEAFEKLGQDLPPDIEKIAEAVEALGYGALGTRDALKEMAEELRRLLDTAGAFDPLADITLLGEERLESLKGKIQEVLDAFAEYGEQVPADIQAVADKLGVLTTIAEKEFEKQAKEAEKAATAEEKASKRRVDALEKVAESFRKLREEIEGAGGGTEIDELEKKLDELEDQQFEFTGSLEDLDALNEEIATVESQLESLRDAQGATGESAKEMANSIDDAIRGLIDQLEPVYARLSESQRGSVESILSNLQLLGQDGVATGEDVSASLQSMINVLEEAGQPTADLRSALDDMRQGGLDVQSAFKALREEIEKSYQEMEAGPEGVGDSIEKLKKDVDAHVQELGRLKSTYDNTFKDIEKRMTVALSLWDRLIEKCEQHKQCLSG